MKALRLIVLLCCLAPLGSQAQKLHMEPFLELFRRMDTGKLPGQMEAGQRLYDSLVSWGWEYKGPQQTKVASLSPTITKHLEIPGENRVTLYRWERPFLGNTVVLNLGKAVVSSTDERVDGQTIRRINRYQPILNIEVPRAMYDFLHWEMALRPKDFFPSQLAPGQTQYLLLTNPVTNERFLAEEENPERQLFFVNFFW